MAIPDSSNNRPPIEELGADIDVFGMDRHNKALWISEAPVTKRMFEIPPMILGLHSYTCEGFVCGVPLHNLVDRKSIQDTRPVLEHFFKSFEVTDDEQNAIMDNGDMDFDIQYIFDRVPVHDDRPWYFFVRTRPRTDRNNQIRDQFGPPQSEVHHVKRYKLFSVHPNVQAHWHTLVNNSDEHPISHPSDPLAPPAGPLAEQIPVAPEVSYLGREYDLSSNSFIPTFPELSLNADDDVPIPSITPPRT